MIQMHLKHHLPTLRKTITPKAHSYLPIEVEIIVNALGEPYGKTY